MTPVRQWLRRFLRSQDGNATVEFVIIFPMFMILFLNAFELGTVMVRQTMLDRGIDIAVRQVRLGAMNPVTHDDLKDIICDRAAILPNCDDDLRLEMIVIDPRDWEDMAVGADCVDVANDEQPPSRFEPGAPNQMMVLRACHLFTPYAMDFSLGALLGDVMTDDSPDGLHYALVSTSSYVVEPN